MSYRKPDPLTDTPLPQGKGQTQGQCVTNDGPCPHHSLLREIKRDLEELNHHITGNGTPERGILIRTDRVEQRLKILWGAFTLGVLALCTLAWKVVQKDPSPGVMREWDGPTRDTAVDRVRHQ